MRRLHTRREAVVFFLFASTLVLGCAAVLGAAALVPAPPVVLPFLIPVCLGCPMATAMELPRAFEALRRPSLTRLRSELAALPETQHPLGL